MQTRWVSSQMTWLGVMTRRSPWISSAMSTLGLASTGGIEIRLRNDDTIRGSPVASSAAMPADGQQVAIGDQQLTWHAVDTLGYNLNLFHFAYARNKPTSNVLFWTTTIVEAPRDIPGVRLAIGSNAASVWWLNGEEVIGLYNDRQAVIDDGVSKRVTLKKGTNVIRAAIVNGGGATDFCARFIDEDGTPVKGFITRVASQGADR